ncbi:MAG: DUF268 domain-containing protein [bacterium]|nr:DUF268 domain-containing protein [bacterium]
MVLREQLKRISLLKYLVVSGRNLFDKHGISDKIKALFFFFRSYRRYRKLPPNAALALRTADLYPRLFDDTDHTPLDPVYFYQNTWCAKKVFTARPERHCDVGSQAEFVGIVSQFVPTTLVDIRPLPVTLPGLSFVTGSIERLPFKDNEFLSLSSLCVIEHIGLGRYGDHLDTSGSEKAAAELVRVLARGGSLYVSVPVDKENKVYFNAHRAFTREYVLELFEPLTLVEEKYVYGKSLFDSYNPAKGFGTGLYHFKKQ